MHDCTENVPGLTFLMFLSFVETIVCRKGIVLWCEYCSQFQSFVLRHLVITPIRNTKKLPTLIFEVLS